MRRLEYWNCVALVSAVCSCLGVAAKGSLPPPTQPQSKPAEIADPADPTPSPTGRDSTGQGGTNRTGTQVKPARLYLPRELAEILRLTKSGVGEDVIVAYIQKTPTRYPITPAQIIALKNVGVAPRVLEALAEHQPNLMESVEGYLRQVEGTNLVASASIPSPYLEAPTSFSPFYPFYFVGSGGSDFAVFPDGGSPGHQRPPRDRRRPHERTWPPSGEPGHHRGGHGEGPTSGTATPWLAIGQQPAPGTSPPWGTPGMQVSPFTGKYPWLPVGAQPASGTAPPWGTPGMQISPFAGKYPWLPVGAQPASGTAPPWGTPDMQISPYTGKYPWLPVGAQPASGAAPPWGDAYLPVGPRSFVAYPVPRNGDFALGAFQNLNFPALPAQPMLPSQPLLSITPLPQGSPFLPAQTGFTPMLAGGRFLPAQTGFTPMLSGGRFLPAQTGFTPGLARPALPSGPFLPGHAWGAVGGGGFHAAGGGGHGGGHK